MAFPDDVDDFEPFYPNLAGSTGTRHEEVHANIRSRLLAIMQWLIDSVKTGTFLNTLAVTVASLTSSGKVHAKTFLRAGDTSGHPSWAIQRYGGTTDASGNAAVAHNLGANGNLRVMNAAAAVRGGAGEWRKLEGIEIVVDGTNLNIVTATANTAWRGYILYSEDESAW